MGFLDRLLGRDETQPQPQPQYARRGVPQRSRSDDEIAIERYRYLLRTAPPETIEQVHAEAFAKLTPEQRRQVYDDLAAQGVDSPRSDSAEDLARSATRGELQQPGLLERSLGDRRDGRRDGPGFGSMLGASVLGTVAGYVIGSALVSAFLPPMDGGADTAGAEDAGADAGADSGADTELAGGDAGGFGDFGGDFGGFGDF